MLSHLTGADTGFKKGSSPQLSAGQATEKFRTDSSQTSQTLEYSRGTIKVGCGLNTMTAQALGSPGGNILLLATQESSVETKWVTSEKCH